jgi:hypothetical protein
MENANTSMLSVHVACTLILYLSTVSCSKVLQIKGRYISPPLSSLLTLTRYDQNSATLLDVSICGDVDELPAFQAEEKWATLFEVIAPYRALCRVQAPDSYQERVSET